MGKEIIWRKKALARLNGIVVYLKSEWGETASLKFVDIVEHKTNLLLSFPLFGRKVYRGKVYRKVLITEHCFALYFIKRHEVIIVDIEDTRQQPKYEL